MRVKNIETGNIIWEGEFRALFPSTSFPQILTNQNIEGTGYEIYEEPPVPPTPVIPDEVSMRQARLQLAILGLLSVVNTAVSGMSELAQISWEYASTVRRSDPLTQQMIALLQWTEEEADTYFTEASQL